MAKVDDQHLEHARQMFFAEKSRREAIRGSLSTPVAALSFAVYALGTLSVEIDVARLGHISTLAVLCLATCSVAALAASAYQVLLSEWLFVYHEPPRLPDLAAGGGARGGNDGADDSERTRGVLAASYAVAYEELLKGNAISAIRRTWALRLILLALLLQAIALLILPFHRGGF
ncbi:hypothetical protein [Erythrobacter sp.]|uniref:hypothetical protein n=1 Tax=Erythrobacter sp. TaxID=1042 RepID=UPI0025E09B30|nr:hypothetical protein [Erythrobacter sp.]